MNWHARPQRLSSAVRDIPQSVHNPRGLAAAVGGAQTIGWIGGDVAAACVGMDDISAEISRIHAAAAPRNRNQSGGGPASSRPLAYSRVCPVIGSEKVIDLASNCKGLVRSSSSIVTCSG